MTVYYLSDAEYDEIAAAEPKAWHCAPKGATPVVRPTLVRISRWCYRLRTIRKGETPFQTQVAEKQRLMRKRGFVLAWENRPPTGQAGYWFTDMQDAGLNRYAINVGRQIARLCGDDSKVTVPIRSLADAVGESDATGPKSYVERGVRSLVEAGWLRVEVTGKKRGARTTYFLDVGDGIAERRSWFDALSDAA